MRDEVDALAGEVGLRDACQALDYNRATYYREAERSNPQASEPPRSTTREREFKQGELTPNPLSSTCIVGAAETDEPNRATTKDPIKASCFQGSSAEPTKEPLALRQSPRKISDEEEAIILAKLNSDEFADSSPYQVYGELLSQGIYHCSIRSMYRILDKHDQVRERRHQRRHPHYPKPQASATAPNQVWTYDITKLPTSTKGIYYSLYVILDLFSRFVVGWMIAKEESSENVALLIKESCRQHQIKPGTLLIHSDRGAPMTSGFVAEMFDRLGITKSFSRPRVSNDNPQVESLFKTVKYHPNFPRYFNSEEHASSHFRLFFDWYCYQHCHIHLALLTPAAVHFGDAERIIAARQLALNAAYAAHPERFVNGPPLAKTPPPIVHLTGPTATPMEAPQLQPVQ